MLSSTFSTRMAFAAPTGVSHAPFWVGSTGDEPARKAIEEQDNAIAEKAGRPRILIKKITRSPV